MGRDTKTRYKQFSEIYRNHNKNRPQFLNDHDREEMRASRSGSRPVISSDAPQQTRSRTSDHGFGS